MRMLTDAEAGFVAGGQSNAADMQAGTQFCAGNPAGSYQRESSGRDVRVSVAGTGITVGGGSTKVVVKCGGRTEDTDDDKKEES